MLGLGIPEMVLIMVVALLIFGPKKLPEIGQSVGKALREFKKGMNDLKDNFDNIIPEDNPAGKEATSIDPASPVSASGTPPLAPSAQAQPPAAPPVVVASVQPTVAAPPSVSAPVQDPSAADTENISAN